MNPSSNDEKITIKNARAHNLKNVSVEIPRDQLVVVTGPSGSGKSSLAFDTIYAEGQRRYVESLSVYARQFIDQLSKPEVEAISGLSPTIAIEQRTTSYNPRSTVGTVTEVYDFLRLLFARISKPYCYNCSKPIRSQSPQQIVDQLVNYPEKTKLAVLAPIVRDRKGTYLREITNLRGQGFVRARIDGEIYDLSEEIKLDRNKRHNIDVYVDRIIVKDDPRALASRLSEAVELALRLGEGQVSVEIQEPGKKLDSQLFSEKFACSDCGINYPEPEPKTFSFNSPVGACPHCHGLGTEPVDEDEWEEVESEDDELDDEYEWEEEVCSQCNGARLRIESLHFKVADQNIAELCALSIERLGEFFSKMKLTEREQTIAARIVKEVQDRIEFLKRVGVSYLSLDRRASTLSGGEAQRIRLATQIGSSLVGVIYVLDEPSIGLHPRDHRKLLHTLNHLRDMGNTVVVVEHDRETIESADWVLDLGPGAGREGGEVTAQGTLKEVAKSKTSLTGLYLNGKKEISLPDERRKFDSSKCIKIHGAHLNNLKNIDVSFPLGHFVCVTGVSGSGKSSLVIDTLYPLLKNHVYKSDVGELKIKTATGLELIDKVVDINQTPIGKTPRSNPATYTGLFSLIRDLFAQLPESKIRGFKPGRFSFNVKGGRCDECEGGGMKKVVMHFLPDVYVECEVCHGSRYNRETLDIRYKGKNIAEVLQMTCAEAYEFFDAIPLIKQKLKILNDVGLGYITLGQSAKTLSGGEAQRMKLSKELSKRSTGKTFYILDEPSTGLHFDDVKKLIEILHQLAEQGNTVVVIEHNLDIIKVADTLIDIGPEGGERGGQLIAFGSPEKVAKTAKSHTGSFLKEILPRA